MSLQRTTTWPDGVTIEEPPLFLDLEDTLDLSLFEGPAASPAGALPGRPAGRFRVIDGGTPAWAGCVLPRT